MTKTVTPPPTPEPAPPAPPRPRMVPARCAADPRHPSIAWLDRDGEARCATCRPPAGQPAWSFLPPGADRAEAQKAAARVEDAFLRHFYPERAQKLPRSKRKPNPVWEIGFSTSTSTPGEPS